MQRDGGLGGMIANLQPTATRCGRTPARRCGTWSAARRRSLEQIEHVDRSVCYPAGNKHVDGDDFGTEDLESGLPHNIGAPRRREVAGRRDAAGRRHQDRDGCAGGLVGARGNMGAPWWSSGLEGARDAKKRATGATGVTPADPCWRGSRGWCSRR